MKTQMTQIGIGLAALSALAVEGKDFNREELNAMLDKLAASPEPKVRRGPQATCYKMAMPQPERFEYVCKKCGTHTVYPENINQMANALARYRDEAAKLKALGLDIALDESALCQKCNPTQDFCWINAQYISETGELLGDSVNLRAEPKLESKVLGKVSKYRGPLRRLPAKAGIEGAGQGQQISWSAQASAGTAGRSRGMGSGRVAFQGGQHLQAGVGDQRQEDDCAII